MIVEVQEFIESGKIELYLLDALQPEEKAEVEAMASSSTQVAAELKRVAASMEAYAVQEGIEPAASLKENIGSKLSFAPSQPELVTPNLTLERPVVSRSLRSSLPYQYALAASLALLLVSLVSLILLSARLKETRNQYTDLLIRTRNYSTQVAYFQSELHKSKLVMNDPDYRKLPLPGVKTHTSALAVVWWNKKQHTVMIDPSGLPPTDPSHSYQLWAIVKGKPVDAGVFEVRGELPGVSQLKDVADAQAFAITLEKRGGVISPTMSSMYVMSSI